MIEYVWWDSTTDMDERYARYLWWINDDDTTSCPTHIIKRW